MGVTLIRSRVLWAVAGLMAGWMLANLQPQAPIEATATSQTENFAICTGAIDEDGEAVYMLDFLTGDLRGAVTNPQNGKFTAFYSYNVVKDLGVDVSKKPQYTLVAGNQAFRRSPGGVQLGDNVVYVAELTSGKLAAYGVPWSRQLRSTTAGATNSFIPLDVTQFRNVVIRDQ